jgi:hypothetical protein
MYIVYRYLTHFYRLLTGKAYRLSFVNYSLYLVELSLLFVVNALYQSMG